MAKIQNVLFLIWLDSNIDENSTDCQNTISQLQQVISSVNIFTDGEACIRFVKNIADAQACLIISGTLGERIVPQIHNLIQVDSIFIFCNNKTYHEKWVKNWPKIKGVFTEIKSICTAVKMTARQSEQDSISMSFVDTNVTLSKDQIEPSFMYTTILKEILLTIQFEEQHIRDYIEYCRNMFANNPNELKLIDKFESQHRTKSAVWWYTYECFLYVMLNRALRQMDGNIIIKMGFFITYLHQQIDELYREQLKAGKFNKSFIVYRGQKMAKVEFEKLQKIKNGLLSFNNFLSTSKKREIGMNFASSNDIVHSDNVGILFVMTIEPHQSTTSFASVAHISDFGTSEDEILFAMHSVFRINEIKPMNEHQNVYQVNLTLTTDKDKDLQILTDRIREECAPNSKGWFRVALVLNKMGQFETAQQVYEMLLEQETVEKEKAVIFNQLGQMMRQRGKYKEAICFYEKDLEISQKTLSPNHPELAVSYNNIGVVYEEMHDYTNALLYYEKALKIKQQTLPSNHLDFAGSYNNIGNVYDEMGEYAKAISSYEQALVIKQQSLPQTHPSLATTYNNLGTTYERMKNYSKARSCFEKAVDIAQKSLPATHPTLKKCQNDLERIKTKM